MLSLPPSQTLKRCTILKTLSSMMNPNHCPRPIGGETVQTVSELGPPAFLRVPLQVHRPQMIRFILFRHLHHAPHFVHRNSYALASAPSLQHLACPLRSRRVCTLRSPCPRYKIPSFPMY